MWFRLFSRIFHIYHRGGCGQSSPLKILFFSLTGWWWWWWWWWIVSKTHRSIKTDGCQNGKFFEFLKLGVLVLVPRCVSLSQHPKGYQTDGFQNGKFSDFEKLSSGASGGSLQGGASFKVEKAHFAA